VVAKPNQTRGGNCVRWAKLEAKTVRARERERESSRFLLCLCVSMTRGLVLMFGVGCWVLEYEAQQLVLGLGCLDVLPAKTPSTTKTTKEINL
jgi:hypothetical protein